MNPVSDYSLCWVCVEFLGNSPIFIYNSVRPNVISAKHSTVISAEYSAELNQPQMAETEHLFFRPKQQIRPKNADSDEFSAILAECSAIRFLPKITAEFSVLAETGKALSDVH